MVGFSGLEMAIMAPFGVATVTVGVYVGRFVVGDILKLRIYERRFVRSLASELELISEISDYSHLSDRSRKGLEILSNGKGIMAHYSELKEMSPAMRNRIRELANTYPIEDFDDDSNDMDHAIH